MIAKVLVACIRHRRTVLAVVIAVTAASLVSARNLRLDALPDVTGNQVVVLTRAPGYTPEEVERLVTRPIEVALGGLPGLVHQRSVSLFGLSSITAIFEEDFDVLDARTLMQERLAGLQTFPEGVEPPQLGPLTGGLGEIFQFTLSSAERTPAELLELAELRIAPLLRDVPGVVEMNTWGGYRRTLDVVGDPVSMAALGVDLTSLARAEARAAGNAAGHALEAGPAQVLLRGRAWPTSPADLGAAVVRTDPNGGVVRIADVASVRQGALPRLGAATADGAGETVYVVVQMLRGENALDVLAGVHRVMERIEQTLPEDLRMDVVYDRSELVEATLRTVAMNLLEGGLLVIVVLFLVLGSARAGLIVALTIPLSMVGAQLGMVLFGIPGNLMSLGAIDFGLLVDGAVVLVEAVFHRFEAHPPPEGEEGRVATIHEAVAPVARPVFFSVAIIILVYVPILSLSGVDGKLFRPMAITVVFALATALVLTMTFVPAALSLFLRRSDVPTTPPRLVRGAERLHGPALDACARHPRTVALLSLLALAGGATLFARAGVAFVPQLDEGDLVIQTVRAPDISSESAVEAALRLERAISDLPEIEQVVSRIGSPAVATDVMGLELSDVFVRLAPKGQWRPGLTKDALIEEIAQRIDARAPGAQIGFTQPIQMRFNELVGGDVTDVSLSIYGDDLDRLRGLAEAAVARLRGLPGAVDVRVLASPSVPLLEVTPDPLRAARYGLDPRDILDVVRAFRVGIPVGEVYDGAWRVPLRTRLETPSAFDLGDAMVPATHGLVPLSEVAEVRSSLTPSLVNHESAQRRIVVGFNVRGRDLGTVVTDAQRRLGEEPLPAGFTASWGGQYRSLEEAERRLGIVMPVVLAGMFALLLLLFRAVRPVLVILTHVPFAALGGIVALTLRGMPVSISAAIGFIALSGIAVLNGVVLVSAIRREVGRGVGVREASLMAGKTRLRPVMTTALVAALGFVPMMLATGVGAEVQRPLATVVVGGLFTSTILTLLILPVLYPMLSGSPRGETARGVDEDLAG